MTTSRKFGARPVSLSASTTVYSPLDVVAGTDLLEPRPIPRHIGAVSNVPAMAEIAARAPLETSTPVLVTGLDGGIGRTLVTELLLTQAAVLRPPGQAVGVDGVPLWGRLSAQSVRRGGLSVVDGDELNSLDRGEFFDRLAINGGRYVLPGPAPERRIRSTPEDVVHAVHVAMRHSHIVVVDTAADPTAAVSGTLIEGTGVIVLVASETQRSIWGIEQFLAYAAAAGAPDIYKRTVAVIRHEIRHRDPVALAAREHLQGVGVQTVSIPHEAGLNSERLSKPMVLAATRLLAAVVSRCS